MHASAARQRAAGDAGAGGARHRRSAHRHGHRIRAIPAVVAYNRYSHDIDRLANRFESFTEEFSNILHRQAVR
jgi:hypothetical protein